jgi:AcrR family transcriptional regulator
MATPPKVSLEPRKTPVQARSTVTAEAISEATIQVLLTEGPDRLTTTRVALRAGVSVGTLYQYFPNKHSLLFTVLEQHLRHVADAVENACQRNHGQQVSTMIESVVQAFADAKMKRSDVSMATGREAAALVNKIGKRGRIALASMLATASDAQFADLPFTTARIKTVTLSPALASSRRDTELWVRPQHGANLPARCPDALEPSARNQISYARRRISYSLTRALLSSESLRLMVLTPPSWRLSQKFSGPFISKTYA